MGWSWFSWGSSPSTAAATAPITGVAQTAPLSPPASVQLALVTPPAAAVEDTLEELPTTKPKDPYIPLPESVRLRRQLTLLIAGPVFQSAALVITRRSMRRRHLSAVPLMFHSNQHPPSTPPSGAHEAFEALNLATLNIMAFAITLVGGSMFALDVCNVEELRRKEEMEEWMVGVLARKELRERAKRRAEEEEERMRRSL
ncbi:hypothetical protein BDZ91DRAFT_197967 [Kalaharituber pfeilii]|nr:hypothetical protein BDZ91DRAFT_197967 [Kalaharituber pfeilii]